MALDCARAAMMSLETTVTRLEMFAGWGVGNQMVKASRRIRLTPRKLFF
jgi:hypothetical protein